MAAVKTMRAVPRAKTAAKKDPPSAGADPLGHLRTVAEALNQEVAAALEKPEVEVVHKLRTGTRRVEATLETILREHGGRVSGSRGSSQTSGHTIEAAARAWLGELKKVRRAAGEVRDLDVHREIVADEFLKAGIGAEKDAAVPRGATVQPGRAGSSDPAVAWDGTPQPQSEAALREQAESLDAWLAGRRDKRADKLVRKLGKLQSGLRSHEETFLQTAGRPAGRQRRAAPRNAGRLALEDFLRLVDRMPVLDPGNLHDFRKGAKKARYVAEADDNDPWAKAIGKAIKQVQDAIGDWHDWLVLGEEAAQALGAAGAPLCERIAAGVAIRFTRAMRTTERMRRRLLGEWLAVGGAAKRRGPAAVRADAQQAGSAERRTAGAVV